MLKLEDIDYHPATSEEPVLKAITFNLEKGTPLIISGPSGSGKTSLIEIISGLTKQNNGQIFWKDKLLSESRRRELCGVVFQFPERHFIGMTITEELRIGHRRLGSEIENDVLRKVGLDKIGLKELPEKLSGGQQRRLAIGVQLVRTPQILLLDEPTAGLDWSVRDEILVLIKNLAKDLYTIIVTHEPDLFSEWVVSKYQLRNGVLTKHVN